MLSFKQIRKPTATHTRQESTARDGNNQLVHTVTTSSYDSHNRLSHVVQTNVLTGATALDESFSYDAAGDRREVSASSDGTTQQAWYTYDGDNRVVVSDGTLGNGQILITADANSYAQSYDANGNVVSQRTVNAAGDTLLQRNCYDSRNELIRADYVVDLTTGGASRSVEETCVDARHGERKRRTESGKRDVQAKLTLVGQGAETERLS